MKRRTPLKRTPFKRNPGKPMKRSPLRKRSVKRSAEENLYSKLKKQFFSTPENRLCRVSVDEGRPHESGIVHHIRGREGRMLNRTEFWLPVCWKCHERIETEKAWAFEKGYRASRDRKTMETEGIQ